MLILLRCMPIESLHTILLGPYKYLLKSTVPTLSRTQKQEVLARIRAFNTSGFHVKLVGNVICYHQSFVGRDYKAWTQMALFIIYPYLTEEDKTIWLSLSKVGRTYFTKHTCTNYALSCRSSRLHTATFTTLQKLQSGMASVKHLSLLLVDTNLP